MVFGDLDIINRGICYNNFGTPTTGGTVVTGGTGTTDYLSIMTGLASDTDYYVRAYAQNDFDNTKENLDPSLFVVVV